MKIEMGNERDRVVLAALLHDIGKFGQRADSSGLKGSTMVSPEIKNLEESFCPFNRVGGYWTHKHVIWTAEFIKEHHAIFSIFDAKNEDAENSLMRLAGMHHNPSSHLQKVVQLADWLSSGVDRTLDPDSQKDVELELSWEKFKKTRLRSIFEGLRRPHHTEMEYLLPLRPLDLDEGQFPEKERSGGEYAELWSLFNEDVKNIQANSTEGVLQAIHILLQKYTHTIPSSTQHLPDVSLYDHLKSTSALALCLYDFLNEKGDLSIDLKSSAEQPFLLIGADVSGIQSFIYDIISKNAAKNLKGRSFYLQLTIMSIAETIMEVLGLYDLNMVYNSGGGFYLLAPNTSRVNELLPRIKSQIQDHLFNQFGNDIYVAIDSVSLSCSDLFDQRISEKWRLLSERLNADKRSRYSLKIESEYDRFFSPSGEGGESRTDAITGKPLEQDYITESDDEGVPSYYNPITKVQIDLGQKLRRGEMLVSSQEALEYTRSKSYRPAGYGPYYYLFSEDELSKLKKNLKGSMDQVRVRLINDLNVSSNMISGGGHIYDFMFYGGNEHPVADDGLRPKYFDELASEGPGIDRLGVLRMDVDSLGQVFINGIRQDKQTFSRYATLSRNLDWFFKGYLNTLWKEDENFRNKTQIIYSGGDDLFIVGQWATLIQFAKKIRNAFNEWVCHNPNLTLSGGLAIVGKKYPIMKAASDAEDEEKRAKAYHWKQGDAVQEKNAFAFLGHALSWDRELGFLEQLKDKIVDFIKDDGLDKAFISKVYAHRYSVEEFTEGGPRPLNVLWMSAYDLSRMASRKSRQEVKDFIENIKQGIYTNRFEDFDCQSQSNYHFLELLYLASRWAELELRNQ